jgi:catechol 2,3-dioxygenase-like lactoylglutathione lyase family enzyme
MVNDFLHVAIGVIDLEKSVYFYTNVMGMEIDYRAYHDGEKISEVVGVKDARLDICVLKKGNTKLELIDYGNNEKKQIRYKNQDIPGLIHIAFSVDDVDAEYSRIKTLGYDFNSQPMVTRENGPKICYFRGPDNITIELFETIQRREE